jgi:hypothetical protein
MFRVGIVGHRRLGGAEAEAFVYEQCAALLSRAGAGRGGVVALSAIAEGADMIFAEAAVALRVPLEIVRPFERYAADFTTPETRSRYDALRAAARAETRLRHVARSDEAYRDAMDWVVTRSDLLLAAWDGLPASGPGGTGEAVGRAAGLGRPWVHLNVKDFSLTPHNVKDFSVIAHCAGRPN